MARIVARFDSRQLAALSPLRLEKSLRIIMKRANATALRDMVNESVKRVAKRKRLKRIFIKPTIKTHTGKVRGFGIGSSGVAVNVLGDTVPLILYKPRQIRMGISVAINRGQRTRIKSAFIATMDSGHRGVFKRLGDTRLKIRERIGSRPVDALLHAGEAEGVAQRGRRSFVRTVDRLFAAKLSKMS